MSDYIIWAFIVQFTLLFLVSMFERNPGMMFYGLGGAVLNLGILMMKGA